MQQLRKTLAQRATDKLKAVLQKFTDSASGIQKAVTLRDQATQNRIAALKQEVQDRQTISEQQQLALDAAIQDKMDAQGIELDPLLMSKEDVDVARQASEEAARAALETLRQAAYAQSQALASGQIARLVSISQAEQKRLFELRSQQILADSERYIRERELGMLADMKSQLEGFTTQLQQEYGPTLRILQDSNYFVPILRQQVESAAANVNQAAANITQILYKNISELQDATVAQATLYTQIAGLVSAVDRLRLDVQFRISNIREKDSAIPDLMATRSNLIPRLNALQAEITTLLNAITSTPSPSTEATKVVTMLQELQGFIHTGVTNLYTEFQTKSSKVADTRTAYDDAVSARQKLEIKQRTAIQTISDAASLQIDQFNTAAVTLADDIAAVQTVIDTSLQPAFDSFDTTATLTKGYYDDATMRMIPAEETSLDTYQRETYNPKLGAVNTAFNTLDGTKGNISRMDMLATLDSLRIATELKPSLTGGHPTKSERLQTLESRMASIRTYLDVTLPGAISGAIITANGAKFIADGLYQAINDASAIFKQLSRDTTNSSASVEAYLAANALLGGLRDAVRINMEIAKGYADSVNTETRHNLGRFSTLYRALFLIQKNYFNTQASTFRGSKTTAASSANRGLAIGSAADARAAADFLQGKMESSRIVEASIRVLDDFIQQARLRATKSAAEGRVVVAQSVHEGYVQNVIGPKTTEIGITNGEITTNTNSAATLFPSLAPLLQSRTDTSATLETARTDRGADRSLKTSTEIQEAMNRIRLRDAQDLLSIRSVRSAAYAIASGLKTRYEGDRTAVNKNQSGLTTAKTDARDKAGKARDDALKLNVLDIKSGLVDNSNTSDSINASLNTYDTKLIPEMNGIYAGAHQRFITFVNLYNPYLASFLNASGTLQLLLNSSSILTDLASQKGIVDTTQDDIDTGGQQMTEMYPKLLPGLDNVRQARDDAKVTLDSTKTLRDIDEGSKDDFDMELERSTNTLQTLNDLLNLIQNKAYYRVLYGQVKKNYSDARDTYREIRLKANEDKVNSQITNESYIARADLFQTATDLDVNTDMMDALPSEGIYTGMLQQFRTIFDGSKAQNSILAAIKADLDTRLPVEQILNAFLSASARYSNYIENTLVPAIDFDGYMGRLTNQRNSLFNAIYNQIYGLLKQRTDANQTLTVAQQNRARLVALQISYMTLVGILTVKEVRAAAKKGMQDLRDRFLIDRQFFDGKKGDARSQKQGTIGASSGARSAALQISFGQTVAGLDSNTTTFNRAESRIAELELLLQTARSVINISSQRINETNLKQIASIIDSLQGSLTTAQTNGTKLNVPQLQQEIDTLFAQLPGLSSALQIAQTARSAANTTLTGTQGLRNADDGAKTDINNRDSLLTSLLKGLQGLGQTVTNRSLVKGIYEGFKASYVTLRGNYTTRTAIQRVSNETFKAQSDVFTTAVTLSVKTNDLAALRPQDTFDTAIQAAQRLLDDSRAQLSFLGNLKTDIEFNTAYANLLGKLQTATATYTNYVENAVNPKMQDLKNFLDLVDQLSKLSAELSTRLQARIDSNSNLQGAIGMKTRLETFQNSLRDLQGLLSVKSGRQSAKSILAGLRAGFFATFTQVGTTKTTQKEQKEGATTAAVSARGAALAVDLSVTAQLDSKTKDAQKNDTDRLALEQALREMNTLQSDARTIQKIAAGVKTDQDLSALLTLVRTYSTNLQNFRTLIQDSKVPLDQSSLDDSIRDMNGLFEALNRVRESRSSADTTLNTTKDARDDAKTTKQLLNDTIGRMNVLLDVYKAFYTTINDRTNQKATLRGLRSFYEGLKGKMRERVELNKAQKEAAATAKNTALSELVAQVNEVAAKLNESVVLDSVTKAKIDTMMELVNIWTNVRDDVATQRLNDPTMRLRNLLAEMLDLQNKLDGLNEKMKDITIEINETLNILNNPNLSQEVRTGLREYLEQLLRQRTELETTLNGLKNELRRMNERLLELLREIDALRQLLRDMNKRLPGIFFLPIGITAPVLLIPALIATIVGPGSMRPPGDKPVETDCATGKAKGYRDGFEKGASDGFTKGYNDAKAQFEKDRRAAYLANLQSQSAAQPAEEDQGDEQTGGQYDAYEEKEPEEAQAEQPVYQLPSTYTVPYPDTIPVPNATSIIVPQLPGVTPQYQFCYEQGYIDGYKAGFQSTYLKGYKRFIPSQDAFLPPVEREQDSGEAEEEQPSASDFGYAAPQGVLPTGQPSDGRVMPSDVRYPEPAADEAYRNQFARVQQSQFSS